MESGRDISLLTYRLRARAEGALRYAPTTTLPRATLFSCTIADHISACSLRQMRHTHTENESKKTEKN